MKRTEFLHRLLLGAGAIVLGQHGAPALEKWQTAALPRRPLGRTGEKVGMLALGGFHVGQHQPIAEAEKFVHRALDAGITFFDTAESYQNGYSEQALGRALKGRRQRIFLMSKTYSPQGRTAESARKHLEGTLRRLQTDYLDLWQLHSLQSPADADLAFREGGAMEYIMQAKKAGTVRFIGVTGHRRPEANLRALAHFDAGWHFDTMQMPINALDFHQSSFQRQVLPGLIERGIGVLAMKTSADGRLLRERICSIEECLRYVWSLPVSTAVVGMLRAEEIVQNAGIARSFRPLPAAERDRLLERIRPRASLSLEWYKA